jgi:DNA polymerase alpha subunit B
VNLCQIYNISAENLFYKWEAINFASRSVQFSFTMDSAHALKAQIQRDLAAESSRRQQAKSNMLAGMNKGRPSGMARLGVRADATAAPSITSMPRSDKFGGVIRDNISRTTGPTKVSFTGLKSDEDSRRKRACEFDTGSLSTFVIFGLRQVYARENIRAKRR